MLSVLKKLTINDVAVMSSFGLKYLPKKYTMPASAAITSGVALYFYEPSTFVSKVLTTLGSSVLACITTEVLYRMANRCTENFYKEVKDVKISEETRRSIDAMVNRILDEMDSNGELERLAQPLQQQNSVNQG